MEEEEKEIPNPWGKRKSPDYLPRISIYQHEFDGLREFNARLIVENGQLKDTIQKLQDQIYRLSNFVDASPSKNNKMHTDHAAASQKVSG